MHGRKKIRSECESIGFKNDRLNYKCKRMWGKKCTKSKNEPIKNVPITHQSCKSDLDKFFLLL